MMPISCFGERVVGLDLALDIVDTWLKAEFQGGRHAPGLAKSVRLKKIQQIGEIIIYE